jgi:hypothetical protein
MYLYYSLISFAKNIFNGATDWIIVLQTIQTERVVKVNTELTSDMKFFSP